MVLYIFSRSIVANNAIIKNGKSGVLYLTKAPNTGITSPMINDNEITNVQLKRGHFFIARSFFLNTMAMTANTINEIFSMEAKASKAPFTSQIKGLNMVVKNALGELNTTSVKDETSGK